MSRTNRVVQLPSRNLRAVSRSNSCSSLKPISILPVRDADRQPVAGIPVRFLRCIGREAMRKRQARASSERPRSERHVAGDGAAVHYPSVAAQCVAENETVQQAPIVPNDEVAGPPAMRVDEFPPRRMRQKLCEKRGA